MLAAPNCISITPWSEHSPRKHESCILGVSQYKELLIRFSHFPGRRPTRETTVTLEMQVLYSIERGALCRNCPQNQWAEREPMADDCTWQIPNISLHSLVLIFNRTAFNIKYMNRPGRTQKSCELTEYSHCWATDMLPVCSTGADNCSLENAISNSAGAFVNVLCTKVNRSIIFWKDNLSSFFFRNKVFTFH